MSQLEYIFPLRPDFNVQIIVPQDMTTLEAQRLAAFLLTLAIPVPDGLERQRVIEFSAEGILRGLVDAIAGEQEDPGELARALGREAPHWIARARALLKEGSHVPHP